MVNTLKKDDLQKRLGVATKIIGNRRIAYVDMKYLTLYTSGGKLWYQSLGDGHEMLLEVGEFKGEAEVNIEYERYGNVLKNLQDDITLVLSETGVDISDGSAKATLASYEAHGIEIDKVERSQRVENAKEQGERVEIKPFLDALVYLYGLRGRDADEDLMEDIYFTETYGFIFDERFVVRVNTGSPVPLVLTQETADTLIAYLRSASAESDFWMYKRTEGEIDFVLDDNYYGVSGMSSYIKDVSQILDGFEPEHDVTVELSNFVRFISLATVFLEQHEEDVVCKIDGGQGRVISDTENSSSDGTFKAEGVDGVEIGLNAYDILTIIGGLRGTVGEELVLQLNLTEEMAKFKHDKGDVLISIMDRS